MRFASLVLALSLALPAAAQDIRPADRARMDGFEMILGRAVLGALAEGAPTDIAALIEALRGNAVRPNPAGDWTCRTLKLGGILPLVAYGNFRCRISETGPGRWRLEKLTGSQFTAGDLIASNGAVVYLGVGYVSGGPATGYAGLPADDQTPVEPGQTTADVGFFEQMGPDRARLLLPDPILESDFDILYFTR